MALFRRIHEILVSVDDSGSDSDYFEYSVVSDEETTPNMILLISVLSYLDEFVSRLKTEGFNCVICLDRVSVGSETADPIYFHMNEASNYTYYIINSIVSLVVSMINKSILPFLTLV
jgi:hypothetical protein